MKEAKVLQHDPLAEADRILEKDFYGRTEQDKQNLDGAMATANAEQTDASSVLATGTTAATPAAKKKKPKPTHYKVVCISMYTKDIEQLEAKVAELKRRGHTRANKSQLIRFALSQVDIDKVPPTI